MPTHFVSSVASLDSHLFEFSLFYYSWTDSAEDVMNLTIRNPQDAVKLRLSFGMRRIRAGQMDADAGKRREPEGDPPSHGAHNHRKHATGAGDVEGDGGKGPWVRRGSLRCRPKGCEGDILVWIWGRLGSNVRSCLARRDQWP